MQNYRFSQRCFFINILFDMRNTKIKMKLSCSRRRTGWEHVPFDLERSVSKFYLRLDQVKLRSRSDRA